MAANKGRKNAYESKIRSRFADIEVWVKKGFTQRSIANKLGIAYSTFNKYKVEKTEFAELLKKGREYTVDDVENAMYLSALGGKQTVKKGRKVKNVIYSETGKRLQETETVELYEEEVYIPPNTTAGIFLLKCWGKDRGYTNDPALLELKKKELELKEKAQDDEW